MKPITIALAMSLAFVNSSRAETNLPEIEVVNTESQRWHFRQVAVDHTDTERSDSGWMDAHLRYGLPRGHLSVAAWSADNELITETTTDYSPRLLDRRPLPKGGARFSAKLPSFPANARIKIAFHQDESQSPRNPVHDQTIAR